MEKAAGRGSSSTKDLTPKQVPALQVTVPVAPEFGPWAPVSAWLGRGHPLAKGLEKILAMQAAPLPPAETNEELVQ